MSTIFNWNSVSQHMTINIPLLTISRRLNWDLISSENLSEQIILEFEDFLNFELLLQNEKQQCSL